MASYTTLVNVDVATATKLSQYISQLVGGAEGAAYFELCKPLIEDAKTEELIAKFLEKIDVIMSVDHDRGSYFNITKYLQLKTFLNIINYYL